MSQQRQVIPACGCKAGNALGLTSRAAVPEQHDSRIAVRPECRALPQLRNRSQAEPANDQTIASVANPINVRDDVVRVDHRINDKWQILGHYMHDSVTQGYAVPMLGWSGGSYNTITSTLSNPSNSAAIKLSGTITPNLLVEASMNYDGNIIDIVNSPNSANLPAGWSGQSVLQQRFQESCPACSGRRLGNPTTCRRPRFCSVAQRRPGLRAQG